MLGAHTYSPSMQAYWAKLESLRKLAGEVHGQLEGELMELLSPTDLVGLWKLRTLIDKTLSVLDRSLANDSQQVTSDMLDTIQQVDQILAHAQRQIEIWTS